MSEYFVNLILLSLINRTHFAMQDPITILVNENSKKKKKRKKKSDATILKEERGESMNSLT